MEALKSESRAFPHLKNLLDSIGPTEAPKTRSQARSVKEAKEKNSLPHNHAILNTTPLATLFIDGMDDDRVWAQLELKAKNVCETLDETFAAGDMTERDRLDSSDDGNEEDEDDSESDELDSDQLEELAKMQGFIGNGDRNDGEGSDEDEDDEGSDLTEGDAEEKVAELRDPSSEEEDIEEEDSIDLDAGPSRGKGLRRSRARRHAGLDDGFFSLNDFNAEIEEAEAKKVSRGSLSKSDDEDSEEDDEIDFFRPVDDDDEEPEAIGGGLSPEIVFGYFLMTLLLK